MAKHGVMPVCVATWFRWLNTVLRLKLGFNSRLCREAAESEPLVLFAGNGAVADVGAAEHAIPTDFINQLISGLLCSSHIGT